MVIFLWITYSKEELHIKFFELRREKDAKIQDQDKTIQESKIIDQEQRKTIDTLKETKQKLTEEVDSLENDKRRNEQEIKKKKQELADKEVEYTQQKESLNSTIKSFDKLVKRKLPFNDEKNPLNNSLNLPKFKKPTVILSPFSYIIKDQQCLFLENAHTAGQALLQSFDKFVNSIRAKLQYINEFSKNEDQRDYYGASEKVNLLKVLYDHIVTKKYN